MENLENQSVNNEEVANPQNENEQVNSVETDVANQKPVQDEQTNAYYADQRRKQELEETRRKAQEYEDLVKQVSELSGYQSPDELKQAIAEAKKQQEIKQYQEAGIDPDKFNQLLENHPDIQFAREMKAKQQQEQQFQQEVNEFFKEFPDVKPDDIKPEVWQLKEQKGISLLDAYLRSSYKSLASQKEQEAIQKLQQNNATSTGSLSGGSPEHNTSIKNMSSKDFEALKQRVLRGENVNL